MATKPTTPAGRRTHVDVGMRQLVKDTDIDFMGKSRTALFASLAVVAVCFLSIVFIGMKWGLDFTGGTVVEVGYPEAADLDDVRARLAAAGFGGAEVQNFGTANDVLIRLKPVAELPDVDGTVDPAAISSQVLAALQTGAEGKVDMRRVEFVGPKVGDELVEQGGLAMLYALIGILIYVTLRFEWRLALGTIAAIVHDVIITVGIFSLLRLEFDLTVLAAVLAVIGYSVNDSVVVLDRIRENFRKVRRGSSREVMNISINQTLSRTLITSGTTLLAVLALLIFGGPIIRNFSVALLIGILVGTYSSIYIASSTALQLGVSREDLLPQAKTEVDDRP